MKMLDYTIPYTIPPPPMCVCVHVAFSYIATGGVGLTIVNRIELCTAELEVYEPGPLPLKRKTISSDDHIR